MLVSTSANRIPLFHSNNPDWNGKLNSEESTVLFDDVHAAQKSLRDSYKPATIIDKTPQHIITRTSKTVDRERIELLNQLRDVMDTKPTIEDSRITLRDNNLLRCYQVLYFGGDSGNTGMIRMQEMIKSGYQLERCTTLPNSLRVRAVLTTDQYAKDDAKAITAHFKERSKQHQQRVDTLKSQILTLSEEIDRLQAEEQQQAAAEQLNDNDVLLNSILNKD